MEKLHLKPSSSSEEKAAEDDAASVFSQDAQDSKLPEVIPPLAILPQFMSKVPVSILLEEQLFGWKGVSGRVRRDFIVADDSPG